jgi:hypothetical protein
MTTSLITKSDLNNIISNAMSGIVRLSLPLYISDKRVDPEDLVSIAVLEAVLIHLNTKKLLVNPVALDYTDAGADHDPELAE